MSPSSRPKAEFLTPPKGRSASDQSSLLTIIIPVSRPACARTWRTALRWACRVPLGSWRQPPHSGPRPVLLQAGECSDIGFRYHVRARAQYLAQLDERRAERDEAGSETDCRGVGGGACGKSAQSEVVRQQEADAEDQTHQVSHRAGPGRHPAGRGSSLNHFPL